MAVGERKITISSHNALTVLAVLLMVFVCVAILLPAIQMARESGRRSISKNNLKQISLALHNYHDTYTCFPSGATFAGDKPLHGWMTLILPYMEATPDPNYIDYQRAWDDPENAFLFRHIHPGYSSPRATHQWTDSGFYLTHYMANPNVINRRGGTRILDIEADDNSKLQCAWFVSEVTQRFQPWGYPFNWRDLISPDEVETPARSPTPSTEMLLMADGSVKILDSAIDRDLRRAIVEGKPLISSADVAIPPRDFRYGKAWDETWMRLDSEEDGQLVVVQMDASRTPHTALLRGSSKYGGREGTISDVREILCNYPDIRVLIAYVDIDDEMAEVLSSAKRLEFARMGSMKVSEQGIGRLSCFRRLSVRDCTESVGEAFRARCPACELRTRQVIPATDDRGTD